MTDSEAQTAPETPAADAPPPQDAPAAQADAPEPTPAAEPEPAAPAPPEPAKEPEAPDLAQNLTAEPPAEKDEDRREVRELQETEAAAIEQAAEDEEPDTPFDKLEARAKRFSAERVRTVLESLLFVTDKPLTVEALQLTTGIKPPILKEQLEKLQGHYRDGVRGIVLHEVSGGWQFRTCPSTSDFVRRFLKVKPQRLTRAALETLAIIAYRQPVTRPEVEDIRAVDSGAVIKALLDRQLIKIIGKKEEPGRPLLYGTTPQFLEFFNLKDLSSLPTLREFQELTEESQQIVEEQTGGEKAEPKGTDGLVADLRDSKLEEKLAASTAEADDALADLETAIADTDTRVKTTARILSPVPPPPPGFAPAAPAEAAGSAPSAPEPGAEEAEDEDAAPGPSRADQDDDDEEEPAE